MSGVRRSAAALLDLRQPTFVVVDDARMMPVDLSDQLHRRFDPFDHDVEVAPNSFLTLADVLRHNVADPLGQALSDRKELGAELIATTILASSRAVGVETIECQAYAETAHATYARTRL